MPDKKRTIEEDNLMNLLSSALKAPVRADASPQPAVRRQWWPRFLAAAAAILVVVLGALWLLPSRPGPPGTVTSRVLTLSFPELQAETLKRVREVETLVITITTTQDGQEQVLHAYYKKPHYLRQDLTSSTAYISDETRSLVLDFQNKKVLEVRPSWFEKASIEDLVAAPQFKAAAENFPQMKVSPAVSDTIDGKPCARFDFEMTFPAQPGPQEPQTKVTGSHWFSSETQLLLRSEKRMAGRVQRSDFQYNVPVDDSLFVIPDWAEIFSLHCLAKAGQTDAQEFPDVRTGEAIRLVRGFVVISLVDLDPAQDVSIEELPRQQSCVTVTLTPQAAERFHSWTQAHVGDQVAVLVNGTVWSVSKIVEPIRAPHLIVAAPDRRRAEEFAESLRDYFGHQRKSEPAGLVRLPGVALPFPQLLAESMRKLDDIDTMVVTSRVTREGKEEVVHSYYKRPNHLREELSKNIVLLDDGTRELCLDLQEGKVREVRSSTPASHRIGALVRQDEFKAMLENDKRPVKLTGPFQDSIDDIACQRYDFEDTMPAQPQIKVPERKVTGSYWFSVETGLMQRFENRSESFASRSDFRYNVPVDDSLFVIPDWARGLKPMALKVIVRDEAGRPTPNATVYFGGLGTFKKLHLDAGGEAELPSEATAHRDPTTDALYVSLGNDVVVESADGGKAALYTFDSLSLVIGKGLKEGAVSQDGKSFVLRDFTEHGPGVDFRYDAEQNSLTLGLTLAPKATVTGRIVDEAGNPVSSSSAVIMTTYRVRQPTASVAYGQLNAQEPLKGGLHARELFFNLHDDGTFELRLPTNYPLTLAVTAVVRPYQPTMWQLTLKPGERVDLGDLVLKSRTPDQPRP